jgi:hypothetical protein
MEKEFVPYEQALALKELEFDGPCFGVYIAGHLMITYDSIYNSTDIPVVKAPTFSQAFRWFREKYTTKGWVTPIVNVDGFSDIHEARIHQEESSVLVLGNYDSYEEAELACLEKLIKIVEQTNAEMTDHGVYK